MRASIRKPAIFVVVSLLVVAFGYSSISAFNVFAAPNVAPSNADCKEYTTSAGDHYRECCWTETDPGDAEGIELYYCQACSQDTGDCFDKRPASQGPTSPPSGPVAPLQGGVLEQPPTFQPFDPTAPLQGGVLEQQEPPTPPPSAPGTTPGILEQLEQGEGVSPGFLERQQQPPAPEVVPPAVPEAEPPITEEADQGTTAAPQTVQPLTRTCPVGNVWDPGLMICVPDVPPVELCPDGSIPQPTGPGGTQPECPPSEAQQLQAEEPEQPEAQEEPQEQLSDEGEEQPTEVEQSSEESDSEDNSNN